MNKIKLSIIKFLQKTFVRELRPSDRLVDYIVNELWKKCPPDEWRFMDGNYWMTHPNAPIRISYTGRVDGVLLDTSQQWEIASTFENAQKSASIKNKERNAQKILDILKSNG